jgi:hypothetical protein
MVRRLAFLGSDSRSYREEGFDEEEIEEAPQRVASSSLVFDTLSLAVAAFTFSISKSACILDVT